LNKQLVGAMRNWKIWRDVRLSSSRGMAEEKRPAWKCALHMSSGEEGVYRTDGKDSLEQRWGSVDGEMQERKRWDVKV